ncbi:dihydroorotate dehydrogenase-like protein [soil metagenome]
MSVDMSTDYLGLRLRSPIVASASPLTGDPAMWEHIEQAGAGALVLPSLFEEQIEHDAFAVDTVLDSGTEAFGESLSYFPEMESYDTGPARHLALVELARQRLSIPVIASLNGTSPGGWVKYARHLQDAGAQAIELNLYDVIVDPQRSASDVERGYVELVEEVRAEVQIPLAVKLGPWFSAIGHLALALEAAGADGLVLFNRLYQPDIDLDTLTVKPRLQLSTPAEAQLPLHWIGILSGFVRCSLAGTTGVHDGAGALKLLLAGADVAMTTSALLIHGPERIATMLSWVEQWMTERDYVSVEQLKGSVSQQNVPNPGVYERANYYQMLHSWQG